MLFRSTKARSDSLDLSDDDEWARLGSTEGEGEDDGGAEEIDQEEIFGASSGVLARMEADAGWEDRFDQVHHGS